MSDCNDCRENLFTCSSDCLPNQEENNTESKCMPNQEKNNTEADCLDKCNNIALTCYEKACASPSDANQNNGEVDSQLKCFMECIKSEDGSKCVENDQITKCYVKCNSPSDSGSAKKEDIEPLIEAHNDLCRMGRALAESHAELLSFSGCTGLRAAEFNRCVLHHIGRRRRRKMR